MTYYSIRNDILFNLQMSVASVHEREKPFPFPVHFFLDVGYILLGQMAESSLQPEIIINGLFFPEFDVQGVFLAPFDLVEGEFGKV